jgi:TATA-binding protein-associated factor
VPSISAVLERAKASVATAELLQAILHGTTAAVLAAAVIRSGRLPAKLNVILQPTMQSVRREAEAPLQQVSARAVAAMLQLCRERKPNPGDKLLKNVVLMACGDPAETPSAAAAAAVDAAGTSEQQQQQQQQQQGGKGSSGAEPPPEESPESVTRRGAEMVLQAAAEAFGPQLWSGCPVLWDSISAPLSALSAGDSTAAGAAAPAAPAAAEPQAVIHALQLLKVISPHLHQDLHPALLSLLPALCHSCRHSNSAVRLAAAACAAGIADALPDIALPALLKYVLPLMAATADDVGRAGAVQLVARLVAQLGHKLVAYTVLLVVPLLGRMSDPLPAVRGPATTCFGALVALLPLAQVGAGA